MGDKDLNLTYHTTITGNIETSCFCTGACTGLGYCPNNTSQRKQETANEKARRLGVKIFEDVPKEPTPQIPNPVIGVCGRCSKEIRLYNNYDPCFQTDCPAGISCVIPC